MTSSALITRGLIFTPSLLITEGLESGIAPPVVPPPAGLPVGGIGHGKGKRRRRRIMLPDGRIITPSSDAEYRAIVAAIIAEAPPEEIRPNRTRRRLRAAVVAEPAVRVPTVESLPVAFYDALAQSHRDMVYHTQVLAAWEAYLAELDDEDAIAVLM
jgi:hypothetical protein